jgi:hypothetical protein
MKQDDVDFFKKWFSGYCRSFYSSDTEDQKNILLKTSYLPGMQEYIDISSGLSLIANGHFSRNDCTVP